MLTKFISKKDIERKWYLVDAKDKRLGDLSVNIAKILIGKGKPSYSSNLNFSDHVVLINAKDIKIHDKKIDTKLYYSHSMYPGGLTTRPYSRMIKDNPEYVIRNSVKGMLPKTKIGAEMINYLHVYNDDNHEYKSVKFEKTI